MVKKYSAKIIGVFMSIFCISQYHKTELYEIILFHF
jgi:hypothetical protein